MDFIPCTHVFERGGIPLGEGEFKVLLSDPGRRISDSARIYLAPSFHGLV